MCLNVYRKEVETEREKLKMLEREEARCLRR